MCRFSYTFFIGKVCFPGGPFINTFAIWYFKACLSVLLNICFGYKSRKNLSNVTNLGYLFHISNLRSYTKNCDLMLNTFYRGPSKYFWIFFYAVTFEWELPFPCFFFVVVSWLVVAFFFKGLLFMLILLSIVLPCESLKYVCLSIQDCTWLPTDAAVSRL